jgi:hypothetical protein
MLLLFELQTAESLPDDCLRQTLPHACGCNIACAVSSIRVASLPSFTLASVLTLASMLWTCVSYQGIHFQEDVHEQGLAGEAAQHVPDKSESKSESKSVRVSQWM